MVWTREPARVPAAVSWSPRRRQSLRRRPGRGHRAATLLSGSTLPDGVTILAVIIGLLAAVALALTALAAVAMVVPPAPASRPGQVLRSRFASFACCHHVCPPRSRQRLRLSRQHGEREVAAKMTANMIASELPGSRVRRAAPAPPQSPPVSLYLFVPRPLAGNFWGGVFARGVWGRPHLLTGGWPNGPLVLFGGPGGGRGGTGWVGVGPPAVPTGESGFHSSPSGTLAWIGAHQCSGQGPRSSLGG